MITSRRSNSAWVAAWRSRSISSFRLESFSMYVSRARQVRLGLVVVEVADEVLDRVLREELAELRVELGGERLVVGQDQGRPVELRDRPGEGRRLARAGRARAASGGAGRGAARRRAVRSPAAGRRWVRRVRRASGRASTRWYRMDDRMEQAFQSVAAAAPLRRPASDDLRVCGLGTYGSCPVTFGRRDSEGAAARSVGGRSSCLDECSTKGDGWTPSFATTAAASAPSSPSA